MTGHAGVPVELTVRAAVAADLDGLAALFRSYLDFYGRPHSREEARGYLAERMARRESIVHVAERGDGLVGFTQCYPTWSSLDLDAMWVIEDLFVARRARRAGVATALMASVIAAARSVPVCRLALETQHENAAAIGLYESLGFRRDQEFAVFDLELGDG